MSAVKDLMAREPGLRAKFVQVLFRSKMDQAGAAKFMSSEALSGKESSISEDDIRLMVGAYIHDLAEVMQAVEKELPLATEEEKEAEVRRRWEEQGHVA